jgi:hypothetical protein
MCILLRLDLPTLEVTRSSKIPRKGAAFPAPHLFCRLFSRDHADGCKRTCSPTLGQQRRDTHAWRDKVEFLPVHDVASAVSEKASLQGNTTPTKGWPKNPGAWDGRGETVAPDDAGRALLSQALAIGLRLPIPCRLIRGGECTHVLVGLRCVSLGCNERFLCDGSFSRMMPRSHAQGCLASSFARGCSRRVARHKRLCCCTTADPRRRRLSCPMETWSPGDGPALRGEKDGETAGHKGHTSTNLGSFTGSAASEATPNRWMLHDRRFLWAPVPVLQTMTAAVLNMSPQQRHAMQGAHIMQSGQPPGDLSFVLLRETLVDMTAWLLSVSLAVRQPLSGAVGAASVLR